MSSCQSHSSVLAVFNPTKPFFFITVSVFYPGGPNKSGTVTETFTKGRKILSQQMGPRETASLYLFLFKGIYLGLLPAGQTEIPVTQENYWLTNNYSYSSFYHTVNSYFFSPSSWTCSSSCCALCHHLTRRRLVPRGDGRHEVAMVPQCGTSRGTLWDWSPQSWGCEPHPQGAQPCAAQRGCCWGAGSTQSWLL